MAELPKRDPFDALRAPQRFTFAGPSATAMGNAGNPMLDVSVSGRTGMPRMLGPGSLSNQLSAGGGARVAAAPASTTAASTAPQAGRTSRLAGAGSNFRNLATVGRTTAKPALGRALSTAAGPKMTLPKGKLGGLGRLGAGLGWTVGASTLQNALGKDSALGGAVGGANLGGNLALMAGRNPLKSPVTAGVAAAEGIANTGMGNKLINAIRPDSWGDLPQGYGVTDTVRDLFGGLTGGDKPDAAPVPTPDRLTAFADQQGIDPGITQEVLAELDQVGALYDAFPEVYVDAAGQQLSREDVMRDANLNAVSTLMARQEEKGAMEQQYARSLAQQAMIAQTMKPHQDQTRASGDLMVAAWKNYATTAPSFLQGYAQFQADQAPAQAASLAAAYGQQAQMIPSVQALTQYQGDMNQLAQQQFQSSFAPQQAQNPDLAAMLEGLAAAGG